MIRLHLRFAILIVCLPSVALVAAAVNGKQPGAPAATRDDGKALTVARPIEVGVGVTRKGLPIRVKIGAEDLDLNTLKTRILLVGGLDGRAESSQAVAGALAWFYDSDEARTLHREFVLSAVPLANPEGLESKTAPANTSGGRPLAGYPPRGSAYNSPTDPEAQYLWRWIGMHAPDLVVEVRGGDRLAWHVPEKGGEQLAKLAAKLRQPEPKGKLDDDELAAQLVREAPCETGTIAALRLDVPGADSEFLPELLEAIAESKFHGPSPARRTLEQRLDRTPLQLAVQLARHYGHDLNQVVYIPALALVARIRLGELTGDEQPLADVERIVAPYFRGEKPTQPKNGSGLSGHLVFCELARVTEGKQRERYIELARQASDLAFDEKGALRPSMPFHSEMSDALFMGGPILSRVGKLTGERRYADACVRHLDFMRKLVLRDDGLYRHSPLDEAAWGRGNGFPALGMAMVLSDLPDDHPDRERLLAAFRAHMTALLKHQDPTGCWHQVIDRPESYRELTATCMIAFAMARGVRRGWLKDKQYRPAIDRAWYAIRTRAPADGRLVDVCTGTGKQRDLRAYYDRTAILGPDARGGAMALMAAVELAELLHVE